MIMMIKINDYADDDGDERSWTDIMLEMKAINYFTK